MLQQKSGSSPAPAFTARPSRRVALASQIEESIGYNADPLPTRADIARKFGVHERTVDRWIRSRLIPYVKVGACVRFRWADVERAIGRFTIREVK